jgi:hypothetical protein
MFHLRILFLLIAFILCTNNAFSETSIIDAYNSLDESEKFIIDTIIEEFRSDHYEFLGEKSTPHTLLLAIGIPFDPTLDKSHDESDGHDHSDDEKLNVVMVRATEEDAQLNNNLVLDIGPYKLTYKELYVVEISEKKITFQVTSDTSDVPGRKSAVPDPKLIERIASRLEGTIQGNTISLP